MKHKNKKKKLKGKLTHKIKQQQQNKEERVNQKAHWLTGNVLIATTTKIRNEI